MDRDAAPAAQACWHRLEAADAARALKVDPARGPDEAEAAARRSVARMVLDQFSDVMILVLIAAAVVSGVVGEPAERRVTRRPPRPPGESIFAHGMWQHIIWVGLLMGAVSLLVQAWAYHTGSAHWQSMVFTVPCLSQLGHVMAIRSETESLFAIGALSNRFLVATVVVSVLLQLATLYSPALNAVFKTAPLDWDELLLCLALSTVAFFAVELEKRAVRRGRLYKEG
ncbi:MAG: cation transporting ATPase C-terminal domain-containing protein [Pseudomonadota bacterium]|jgi:magnesium-transporting ATPase (P-type)